MNSSTIPQNILRPIRVEADGPAPTPASLEHKPILAERFKTKICRNYEMTGVCPYVHRCMFAHGDHELRTKAMNVADNLFTEEAIKNFQRARSGRPVHGNARVSPMDRVPSPAPASDATLVSPTVSTAPVSPCAACSPYYSACVPRPISGTYRHDPYTGRGVTMVSPIAAVMMSAKRVTYAVPAVEDGGVMLP